MIGSVISKLEYEYILPVLEKLKKKYKDKIEIIIFGWDGKEGALASLLKEIGVRFHKSVSFLNYPQVLEDFNFDMVLLPMRPLKYYKYANTIKFLETACLGIPIIAQEYSSYRNVINHGITGLLADDLSAWEASIEKLIDDPNFRKKLGMNAQKWVWENRSYSDDRIFAFHQIFTNY